MVHNSLVPSDTLQGLGVGISAADGDGNTGDDAYGFVTGMEDNDAKDSG